jgi:hypothetical protein
MKKTVVILVVLGMILSVTVSSVLAAKPAKINPNGIQSCIKIQHGVLTYSPGHFLDGTPLTVGFDPYGYNYQGHLYDGSYANAYLGRDGFPPYTGNPEEYEQQNPGVLTKWYWPYHDVQLKMKWNDAWLANTDCDGDGALDRHYGFDSYIGSGAWETNHQSGSYVDDDGRMCNWNYFVKIVAVPTDATLVNGIWYSADGTEIGPEIWGQFAIIQQVENDPCAGIHGLQYVSPENAGLGGY